MTQREVQALFRSALKSAKDPCLSQRRRTRAALVAAALLPIWQPSKGDFAMVVDTIRASFDEPSVVRALSLALAEEYPFLEPRVGGIFKDLACRAFASNRRQVLTTLVYWAYKYGHTVPDEIARVAEVFCMNSPDEQYIADYRAAWEKAKAATEARAKRAPTTSGAKPSE